MNVRLKQTRTRERRADLAVLLIITAVFILFFSPVLFTGKVFVTNDSFVYSYPLRTIAWEQLRHGSLPLWTPLLMSGYPLLSMAQLGIGYPLTWGYLFLPGYVAEEIYVFAPFLLTPMFMYAWLRVLESSRIASLFGALAFTYGGMMFSPIAHNGMLTNTMMWTPLILIAVERSRYSSLVRSLLWSGLAFAMSALTGIGQGIVQVATVVLLYGLFLFLFARTLESDGRLRGTWRPLVVAVGATAIGLAVSAFQIFETLQAQRLSVRSKLSYEIFSEGAFAPLTALKSLVSPLYYQTDVSVYIVPAAVILMMWTVIRTLFGLDRDWRVLFWFAIAVYGVVWMLGPNTFLYPLLYRVPVLNKFRVPSRHTFEWTLAVATMAAYGWDSFERWVTIKYELRVRRETMEFATGAILLVAAIAVAWCWWQSTRTVAAPVYSRPHVLIRFLEWKLLFTLLIFIVIGIGWRISARRYRVVLLVSAIVIACLVEPVTAASYWWWPKVKDPGRFHAEAATTQLLKQKNLNNDRVYTHISIWAEEYLNAPRIDPPNLSALYGIRDVGGYEPLFFDRYSRALGRVTNDGVYPRPNEPFDDMIFSNKSQVLDLLNTRFVISYANLSTIPDNLSESEGLGFFPYDSYFVVKPGERRNVNTANIAGDGLALVTALGHSAAQTDGSVIARLHFHTSEGQEIVRNFVVGVDSAEWAIDNPAIASTVQHHKAAIFDTHPAEEGKFNVYRFKSLTRLGQPYRIASVEIENLSSIVEILVWKATIYDSSRRRSLPLPQYDREKWLPVFDEKNLLVLENQHMLPRVWLVSEAESLDDEEALRRIRGEGERDFDPRRSALLEVKPEQLPRLGPGPLDSSATAEVIAETPGSLSIETNANTDAMLIASEIYYPGWQATVDERPVTIYATDYLLRGVAVPAGKHRVNMRYTAPAARKGAIISILGIMTLLGLGIASQRRRT